MCIWIGIVVLYYSVYRTGIIHVYMNFVGYIGSVYVYVLCIELYSFVAALEC